jgi:purine-cytosine permease-like protein
MILVWQSSIILVIYTIGILIKGKNPLRFYSDYPQKIKERIKSLPQYKDKIPTSQKNYGVKIIALIFLCAVLVETCYYSSATTFIKAFTHVFIITTAINLYDLFILDLIWFCHSRHFRIAGTEDMVEEYKNPSKHIKGFLIGIIISLIASIVVGGIVQI